MPPVNSANANANGPSVMVSNENAVAKALSANTPAQKAKAVAEKRLARRMRQQSMTLKTLKTLADALGVRATHLLRGF